ncbi:uncharacterized protein ABIE26_002819 [Pedobacter africanus]|uniref:Membrane protein YeiB n=1 Tax=Pedobacter africanus TaxID=151894 RepID=A0ACC6KX12_9SPHI|nr:DUF418 domain-containing protein [Pedobacter africanus]MDR6783792.1 putative membrane protein YeiB [Pedobacter africanus]
MKQRIIGFDLARAYAILGMYIVNFNMVFGNHQDQSLLNGFLSLFSGNSSTVFVMLAGMGIALMSNRTSYSPEEKRGLRNTVLKRAGFLFAAGLLLAIWWPADILHFYGGYMLLAACLLFIDKRYYILAALFSVLVFHLLLFFVPYETGWNFETLEYQDFWTFNGFIRSTFYNGWNSIFPWLAYFAIGMYLGRLDWTQRKVQLQMFSLGLCLFLGVNLLQYCVERLTVSQEILFFFSADYLPPFLPFLISTMGSGFMLIAAFMFIGNKVADIPFAKHLAQTGKMTLTHYVSHLTIGLLVFGFISVNGYAGHPAPVKPVFVLLFSVAYFVFSYYFSKIWSRAFKNGPLETVMRWV